MQAAAAVARRFPRLGALRRFVAEIDLPDDARLEPFSRAQDHLTAYGDPDSFVRSTITVVHIDSIARQER